MLENKVPLIDGMRIDMAHKKGGGSTYTLPEEKTVTPAPPVQEDAAVEIEDEKDTDMNKKGKGSLKIPLSPSIDTGLKV